MNLLLFISGIYLITYITGGWIERFRIPWIFAALFLGLILSPFQWISSFSDLDSFSFLAELGILFLLFLIGFDLNIKKIREQSNFIISTTITIILTESILGTIFIHSIFQTQWTIAILVATSFATVGEGVLLPILDEFKITKTNFGQIILGIATLDDVIEIITLIALSFMLGLNIGHTNISITTNASILIGLFAITFIFIRLQKNFHRFKYHDVASLFIFLMFLLLLFSGIGDMVESSAIGALLAGIAAKQIIPQKKLEKIESEIRTTAYGFFVPLFFFQVGIQTNMSYIMASPFLVIAIFLLTNSAKICSSYIVGKNRLGTKQSILLGIGLSAKFSTSIVIILLLLNAGLIGSKLFSILVGAMALSVVIPVLFSVFIKHWKPNFRKKIKNQFDTLPPGV